MIALSPNIKLAGSYRSCFHCDLGFFFQWLFQPIQIPGLLFSSVIIFSHTVGLLGRVVSPSQGRYLNTGQNKHRINAYTHQTSIL
jgi:hypothetical protein